MFGYPLVVFQTGECLCKPGYHSFGCAKPCGFGFFGRDCLERCENCPRGCDSETGKCKGSCPAGRFGPNCDQRTLMVVLNTQNGTSKRALNQFQFVLEEDSERTVQKRAHAALWGSTATQLTVSAIVWMELKEKRAIYVSHEKKVKKQLRQLSEGCRFLAKYV